MNRYKYMFKKLYDQTLTSRLYKYENKMIKKTPKIINSKKFNYINEFNVLKKIDNTYKNYNNYPNIIKINETYEDTDYFYSVMDFYNKGDLYYNIKNKRLSKSDYKIVINKMIDPIYSIHNIDIVHMDIKLENYLLDNKTDNYILIDFHLSKIHTSNYYDLEKISNITGTKNFIAPEIYDGYYCKASDMYSLGCMLYLTYTDMIYNGDLTLLNKLPYELEMLIIDLLNNDYKLRPSIYDLKYTF